MRVDVWDTGFVRAPPRRVHAVLRDVAGYGSWWPGAHTFPVGDGVVLRLRPDRLGARAHGVILAGIEERSSRGVRFTTAGAFEGAGEWYYDEEAGGTVVHYLLHAEPSTAGRRLVRDHRWCVREALHALKDGLEG